MDLLLERYNIQAPPGLDPAEMVDWKKQKQTPIRLRFVSLNPMVAMCRR
jgi:hypothetical protein